MKSFLIGLVFFNVTSAFCGEPHAENASTPWIDLKCIPVFQPVGISASDNLAAPSLGLPDGERISRKKAILLSLLVPGLGEAYIGQWGRGKYLAATEVLLWGGHFGAGVYGNWLTNDSRAFAASHAGVDLQSGKPRDYYAIIGKWNSIYEFNESQRRFAGPTGDFELTDENAWEWDSQKNRKKYDDARVAGDRAEKASNFILFGIVLNHVVSALHTRWLIYRMEKREQGGASHPLDFQFSSYPDARGDIRFQMTLSRSF